MTDWMMQSDSADPRILPRRLGAFVKARGGSAKAFARLIDCDERTAFKIRNGEVWPLARHLTAIWLEFGDDLVEALFYPERAQARLNAEAQKREQARKERAASLVEDRTFGHRDGLDEGDPTDPGHAAPLSLERAS